MKYLLTVSYDGTNYCGYQKQKNGISLQQVLTEAARTVLCEGCSVTGCSRTDSGVHALGFKATVEADCITVPPDKIPIALNSVLPNEVAVLDCKKTDDDFHPRYCAKVKEYRYIIHNSPIKDPFLNNRAYHYPRSLDAEKMNEGASYLVGEHDFSAYMASGSKITDTVRTVYSCSVVKNGDTITLSIRGNGFLYNMVRIIVGTLINVGEGKILPSDIEKITLSKNRAVAGPTAPACGLYLYSVEY